MRNKKITAVILTIIMIFSLVLSLSASQAPDNCCHIPEISSTDFLSDVFTERIYLEDHVFGVDTFLDDIFNNGAPYVELTTFVSEYWSRNGIAAFSTCSVGRHTNIRITGTYGPIVRHFGWGFMGGTCIREVINHWHCSACNTFGTDRQQMPFTCFGC